MPTDSSCIPTRLIAIALLALAAIGCSSSNLPAITDTPTGNNLPGKVVWHDLITDTPDTSRQFFADLFGWEFEQVDLGVFSAIDYSLIRHNGRLIGGMVDQSQLPAKSDISQWIAVFSVTDVDAAAKTVSASGGGVVTPPTNLADRGRLAVVTDPQGALFTLLQTNGHDPVDRDEADVGGFLWDELWTSDVDSASGFYQSLVGYEVGDGPALGKSEYRVLSSQDRPRAGIMEMPVEGIDPVWVPYLRVENPAALHAIVARVESLGGSILLDPQERDIGGQVALIAGPSGAGIALQTWPLSADQGD